MQLLDEKLLDIVLACLEGVSCFLSSYTVKLSDSKDNAGDYQTRELGKRDNSARLLGLTVDEANELVEGKEIFYKGETRQFLGQFEYLKGALSA